MTIDPNLAAGDPQQQQQQQQGADLGAIGDGLSGGADVVGAVLRNLSTGGASEATKAASEAASGIADAAEAGGGILDALGGLFDGLSF